MLKTATVAWMALVAWLFMGATVSAEPPRFDPAARLDTTQFTDSRAVYGELICPAGTAVADCAVEIHACDDAC
jgi:hypothetical protein